MGETDYGPRQISVSRDALRADLAEMELRLRSYFDARIAGKAESSELEQLIKRIDLHEAGVFPPAWNLSINALIDARLDSRGKDAFRGSGRRIELVSLLIALAAAGSSLALTAHYWG